MTLAAGVAEHVMSLVTGVGLLHVVLARVGRHVEVWGDADRVKGGAWIDDRRLKDLPLEQVLAMGKK
jgi:hypothetical protein